jgi:hypothetical protein
MTAAREADILVRRVLDAVPARSHALGALLQLFRVEASEDVPTACVSCERRPVLRVNPRFVDEHCKTDAHLFVLVMHELHHVLLGHTRLFPRVTPAHNVAFDAVINALLCARFPEVAYTSFFTNEYGATTGPLRLLAPPGRPAVEPARLGALHLALYTGRATADEVFHAITTEVERDAFPLDALLGSHGRGAQDGRAAAGEPRWGTEGPVDPAVVDAIRRIVEKWPPPEQPIRGRSLADLMKRLTVAPAPRVDPAVLAATRRALLGAADRGRKEARRVEGPRPALVPLPDPGDRRAGLARQLGTTPILYRSTLLDPRGRGDGATHVYLDVSGSMDPWLEDLYAALGTLRRHVAKDVHLFSTRVETVPLRALLEGLRPTTGGTEIACALEHALAGRTRRVLLVTDGYVGRVPQDLARAVERRGLEVRALLTPRGFRKDLEPIAARIEELPARTAARLERGRTA